MKGWCCVLLWCNGFNPVWTPGRVAAALGILINTEVSVNITYYLYCFPRLWILLVDLFILYSDRLWNWEWDLFSKWDMSNYQQRQIQNIPVTSCISYSRSYCVQAPTGGHPYRSALWQHYDNIMTALWQHYDSVMTTLWQHCDNIMTALWQHYATL
jgi:hypothetical protein